MEASVSVSLRAVGLFSFDSATGGYVRRASVRLAGNDVVFDGPPELVSRLQTQAIPTKNGLVVPADGAKYLLALIEKYTNPQLKAMPLKA